MTRKYLLCLPFALMACSEAEQPPESEMVAESEAEVAQTTYDGGPVEGMYEAVSSEGVVLTQTATSDGNITSVDGDGNAVSGTFTVEGDRFCITNEGANSPSCYGYSDLQEDGSWTATSEDDANDSWTVRRVAEQ